MKIGDIVTLSRFAVDSGMSLYGYNEMIVAETDPFICVSPDYKMVWRKLTPEDVVYQGNALPKAVQKARNRYAQGSKTLVYNR